jgi:SAM-dependent methyltransferase
MERFISALHRGLLNWMSRHGFTGIGQSAQTDCPQDSHTNLFLGSTRKLLHVGCGPCTKIHTGPGFQADDWQEIRLDIDPDCRPDILGTLLDMSAVPDNSVDAVFSSHTLEHLYAHEIPLALSEMRRVLRNGGIVLSTVPDMQAVAQRIAEGRMLETAYDSPAGPITYFDIVYGHRGLVGLGRSYMAHHSGFTLSTLVQTFRDAGFKGVIGVRKEFCLELWILAMESPESEDTLRRLASKFIPGISVD